MSACMRAGAILAEMQELSKAEELLRQSVRLLEVRGAPPAAPRATKVAAATTKLEAGRHRVAWEGV